MENLTTTYEPMNLLNLIAKSSVHLIVFDQQTNQPIQYGSGCLVSYKGKLLVLSVNHVTRLKGIETYALIETGLPTKEGQTPFYSTGGLVYFDKFRGLNIDTKDISQITFEEEEPLDITFTSVKADILLMQKEFEYEGEKITAGQKVILNLDLADDPKSEHYFGFFGHIKHDIFDNQIIKSEVTFKLDLSFQSTTKDRFHLFHANEIIKSKKDYAGTSGAPILNQEGQLVGLACSIIVGTKSVFAFPINYCKQLIDISIDSKLL
jgi:hypothetical protein